MKQIDLINELLSVEERLRQLKNVVRGLRLKSQKGLLEIKKVEK